MIEEDLTLESNGSEETAERAAAIMADDGLSDADRIRELYALGFSRKQMIDEFEFSKQNVYRVLPVHLEGKDKKGEKGTALPATINDGKQQLVPEYLLSQLAVLDGGGFISPLQAILLVQASRRMAREEMAEEIKMLQGLAEAQSKVTDAQLKVLREAKSESVEVAEKAAQEAVAELGCQIIEVVKQQKQPAPSGPSLTERMFQPVFDTMSRQMAGVFGNMFQIMPGAVPLTGSQGEVPGEVVSQASDSGFEAMSEAEREAIFGGDS